MWSFLSSLFWKFFRSLFISVATVFFKSSGCSFFEVKSFSISLYDEYSRLPPYFSGRLIINFSFLSSFRIMIKYFSSAVIPLFGLPAMQSALLIFLLTVSGSSIKSILLDWIDELIFSPTSPRISGLSNSILGLYPIFGRFSLAKTMIFLWSFPPSCESTCRYSSSRACMSG